MIRAWLYIGQQGVYQQGRFCAFTYLADVTLESDNPSQTILFYIMTSSNTYRFRPSDNLKKTYNTAPIRVGVPSGREQDAQALVMRLKALLSSQSTS